MAGAGLGDIIKQAKGLDLQNMMNKAEENDRRIKNIEQIVIQNNTLLKEVFKILQNKGEKT